MGRGDALWRASSLTPLHVFLLQVDPKSTRLQLLTPFKAWHGDDIRDAAILIKVRKGGAHREGHDQSKNHRGGDHR